MELPSSPLAFSFSTKKTELQSSYLNLPIESSLKPIADPFTPKYIFQHLIFVYSKADMGEYNNHAMHI